MAGTKPAGKDVKAVAKGAKGQAKATAKEPAPAGAAAAAAQDKAKGGMLSMLRPKPRPIFFLLFVLFCAWVVALTDRCQLEGKKRDCGWPGITSMTCWSRACFLKGGGGPKKHTFKVKREEGQSLGLSVSAEKDGALIVQDILPGAVQRHNEKQAKEAVLPGDRIVKAEGSTKNMAKALEKTTGRTVEIEVVRPRLPSYLAWLHNYDGKTSSLESVLTAPGTQYFAQVLQFNFAVALLTWYISGYGKMSLPLYFALSGAVAFQLTRCCHDDKVAGGVPHCFRSSRDPMPTVVAKAWDATRSLAARVAEDPRSYATWLFASGSA